MPRSRTSRSLIAVLAAIATCASALAIGAPASARQPTNIEAVPEGQSNALFYFNQRFIPEVAQSFTIEEPTTVTSVSFFPAAVTRVESQYFTTPDSDRHSLEIFLTEYPPTATDATLTVWRSPRTGDLGTRFDTGNGFSQVVRKSTQITLNVGKENTIALDSAVTLEPGTYVVVLGMRFADPNILTLHMTGRESGNNTVGGPNQDRPSNCVYNRSSDSYPGGRAYKGTGSLPYTGAWDNYVGFGTEFIEHVAKVQECIKPGFFNDIFNPGDLMITLNTPRSATESAASRPPSSSTPQAAPPAGLGPPPTISPRLRKVVGKRQALTARITPSTDTRSLTNVVIAFTTPDKAGEAGRCTIKPGKKTCTIKGLASGRTYYLTAGALWNNLDAALAPNRVPGRPK